jgi:signal transduction histidine kinase
MSYAKLEERQADEVCGAAAADDADRLAAQFANGLHALAQPLTVLRSAVVGLKAANLADADRRWYLETSSVQVEHAARLFHMLQDLIAVRGSMSENKPVALSEVVEGAVAAQAPALQKAGIELKMSATCSAAQAVGDKDKTFEVLVSSLETLVPVSSPEDPVELQVSEGDGCAKVILRNMHARGSSLNSEMRLKLALAEAKMRSQHGNLYLIEEPLSITIQLPLY